MKKLIIILAVLLIALCVGASADIADWKVSTVHGAYQFNIENGGSQLRFLEQPRNTANMYWFENNGSAFGTLAINGRQTPNGWRDGSKTYSMTNVAYGQPLNTIKLEFTYYQPDGSTVWNYPSVNFFITDGLGRYGIWSPGSGGVQYATSVRNGDWVTMTYDLTNPSLNDSLGGFSIYEHNGFTNDFSQPYTTMTWGDIKNYKIAGFYDYMRSPFGGWANWSNSFDNISTSWNTFVIRKGSTSGNSPQINNVISGGVPAKEFVINEGGMKAGWGTKALDGKKVSDVGGFISRLDTNIISSPYGPYFNIWITDGIGKFALIANEPSNPEWINIPGLSRNFNWDDLKTKTVKVYEVTDKSWLPNNGVGLTFNDLANFTILSPTPAQLVATWPGLSGGAARELDTNKAYGFNWVFGDTLSNYVNGYIVTEPAIAKNGAVNNDYGITLNWGDTVCSAGSGYDTQQRIIKDVVVTAGGTSYTANFQADQIVPNMLSLDPAAESLYINGSDLKAYINLDVSNLIQPVTGLQSMLNFSSTYFKSGSSDVSVAAGGGVWDNLIWNLGSTAGDFDVSVGLKFEEADPGYGTTADATTAKIDLIPTGVEGLTKVIFRANENPDEFLTKSTFLAGIGENSIIWPVKVNSTDICIDYTAPEIAITSVPLSNVIQGNYSIVVKTKDPLPAGVINNSGLASAPVVTLTGGNIALGSATLAGPDANGDYTYTYPISVLSTTINGEYTMSASITDKAGNTTDAVSKTFTVNKNQITGTVTIPGFVGASRDVTFCINGSTSRTVSLSFTDGVASYALTDVPTITTLSAKTNWTLRQRQAVAADIDGQQIASFTLLAGDINNSNSINILDYSILKANWFKTTSAADVDGSGSVNNNDYNLMKTNWFKTGDAQ